MRRGEGGDGVVVERGDEKAGPARQRGEIGGDARETVVGHVEAGDAQADHPIVGRGADGEGDGADAPFEAQPHRARMAVGRGRRLDRSEEHTSELQSLMRISYAVFRLTHKNNTKTTKP